MLFSHAIINNESISDSWVVKHIMLLYQIVKTMKLYLNAYLYLKEWVTKPRMLFIFTKHANSSNYYSLLVWSHKIYTLLFISGFLSNWLFYLKFFTKINCLRFKSANTEISRIDLFIFLINFVKKNLSLISLAIYEKKQILRKHNFSNENIITVYPRF
jgi:hypothetical protein